MEAVARGGSGEKAEEAWTKMLEALGQGGRGVIKEVGE